MFNSLAFALASALLAGEDGGTLSVNGLPLPSDGFFVAVGGCGGRSFPSSVLSSPEVLAAVVGGFLADSEAAGAGAGFVGFWVDGSTVYLDRVRHFELSEALAAAVAAVAADQVSIWDIGAGTTVETGGDGSTVFLSDSPLWVSTFLAV